MAEPAPALVRKLSRFAAMEARERAALEALLDRPVAFPARTELFYEGERDCAAYVIAEGWVYSYKEVEDGGRQVVNFQLPGDFVGLRGMLLGVCDHASATLTGCRLVAIDRDRWERLLTDFPRLGQAVLWAVAHDESMLVEHLVNIGRRSAYMRTAYLLCEFGHRLRVLGQCQGNEFVCPVGQAILADALGLSVVHLNRTLRKLREHGLVVVRGNSLRVTDFQALVEATGFAGDYLR